MITDEEYNFYKLLDLAKGLEFSRLTNIAGILSHFPDLKVRTMESPSGVGSNARWD